MDFVGNINDPFCTPSGPLIKPQSVPKTRFLKRSLPAEELQEPYDPTSSGIVVQSVPKKAKTEWWTPVVEKVIPIVEMSKNTMYPELEVRLGKFGKSGEFRTGVRRDWFEYHLNKLQTSTVWSNKPKWENMTEFVFRGGVRSRGTIGGVSIFIKKAVIKGCDIPLVGSTYDLRLVLKTEAPSYLKTGVLTHTCITCLTDQIRYLFG